MFTGVMLFHPRNGSHSRLLFLILVSPALYAWAGEATHIPDWRRHIDAAQKLERSGDLDGAERELTSALSAVGHTAGGDAPLAQVLDAMGSYYDDIGKFSEAEQCWTESLALWSRILGPSHIALNRVVNRLATLYLETHQLAKAERLNLEEWAPRLEQEEPASVDLREFLESLGQFYFLQGDVPKAETAYSKALHLTLDADGSETVASVYVLNNLGLMHFEARHYDAAVGYLLRAVRVWDKFRASDGLTAAAPRHTLAEVYLAMGQYSEAGPLLTQALEIAERSCGPTSLRTAAILKSYARFLRAEHRNRDAKRIEERVETIRRTALRAGPSRAVLDIRELSLR